MYNTNNLVVARWYELKGMEFIWDECVVYVHIYWYLFYLLSSPYLLVFGDDRVRGTREQMMLMQVVLVRLSYEVGIAWEL